jgi:hypothetical protein
MNTQPISPLTICKSQIEEKLGWGPASQWASQDFEMLSEKIQEVTHEQISSTTLKRVWGRVKYQSAPSTHTLNTLAIFLDYQNWREFTQSHASDPGNEDIHSHINPEAQNPLFPRRVFSVGILSIIGLLSIAFTWIVANRPKQPNPPVISDPGEITFFSNPVTKGVPNTVIFNYDVSGVQADSFSIQQSWDRRRRTKIEASNQTHTSVYYYPGYFRAKLVANEEVIKEHDVYVESDGWLALLANDPVPVYLPVDSTDGIIRTESEMIEKYRRDNPEAPLDLNYYLVQNFGELQSNDFHLSARIRNTNTFPEGVCQKSRIVIMCSEGRIDLRFSKPGCVGELRQIIGDTVIDGKTHDLSAFGGQLDQWTDVEVFAEEGQFVVRMNGEEIFAMPMQSHPGKIVGLRFGFKGGGEIKGIELNETSGVGIR